MEPGSKKNKNVGKHLKNGVSDKNNSKTKTKAGGAGTDNTYNKNYRYTTYKEIDAQEQKKRVRNQFFMAALVIVAMVLLLWTAYDLLVGGANKKPAETGLASDSTFQIEFIDVGQADAALIECDGEYMLVDGGNAEDSSLIYSYLKNESVTYLDYIICTHEHEDHCGGIPGALRYASVGTVYCPTTKATSDTKAFSNFVSAVKDRDRSITVPDVPTQFELGSARIKILSPMHDYDTYDDVNDTSIVLYIRYGNNTFLMTGDATSDVEKEICDYYPELKCDVLKVGHHGSDTASCYQFIYQLEPTYGVISVGADNSYGHPTEAVLSRLRDADVELYRTDLQGTIICRSDGNNITFLTQKNKSADTYAELSDASAENNVEGTYILNTSSKKFHREGCSAAESISAGNKETFNGLRSDLISRGYSPCGYCDP